MIKKSLLQIITVGVMTIALTSCGEKGVDRKLNYSGDGDPLKLMKSYNDAKDEATPEQQKILQELNILEHSIMLNNFELDQISTKVAELYKRLRKMTLRERVVQILGDQQNELNSIILPLEKFQSEKALKVESISIDDVNPKDITEYTTSIDIDGTLSMRNDSDNFDYDFRGCQLALILDGRQIEELQKSNDCKVNKLIIIKRGSCKTRHPH